MRVISRATQGDIFIFSKETEKLVGRGCVVVTKETSPGKPTTSCISAIKAMPVKIAMPEEDILVNECDCTISVPIQLNRVWSTDVDLIVQATVSPTATYNPSGETIRAAISGVDFHAYSGSITISAGNLYENFDITLISNTGDSTKSFFNVNVVDIEYGTICVEDLSNASIRVVIQPTGV